MGVQIAFAVGYKCTFYITPTYGTNLIADVKYTKIPNNMTVASKERYLELLIGHALTVNSSWKLLKYSHLLFWH